MDAVHFWPVVRASAPFFGFLYVGRREEDAMLLVDAPYTAEVLHAHSGQLHPIYRPLAVYLTRFKYAPKLDQILVPKSRSASVSSQSEWMFHLLVSLAGESFAPKFAIQNSFLGFEDYAAYQAIAYLPGPHSWVLMQWREFYSMDMPLFVPHREGIKTSHRHLGQQPFRISLVGPTRICWPTHGTGISTSGTT